MASTHVPRATTSRTAPRRLPAAVEARVPTDALTPLVQGFVQDWNRQRPDAGQRAIQATHERGEVRSMGAIRWLEQETAAAGAAVSKHQLERIARGRTRTTDFSTADAVLTALGLPHALHDGSVPVVGGAAPDADITFEFEPWSLDS